MINKDTKEVLSIGRKEMGNAAASSDNWKTLYVMERFNISDVTYSTTSLHK